MFHRWTMLARPSSAELDARVAMAGNSAARGLVRNARCIAPLRWCRRNARACIRIASSDYIRNAGSGADGAGLSRMTTSSRSNA